MITISLYSMSFNGSANRVWLQISQTPKKDIKKLISVAMIALLGSYFHLVHCSFIFGHGWLHSNPEFVKHVKIRFCPSWQVVESAACIHELMRIFVGTFTKQQWSCIKHSHCVLQAKFWHALQKWLQSSHPWPNTEWPMYHPMQMKDKDAIILLITDFMIFLFDFERFKGLNLGFLFFLLTLSLWSYFLSTMWLLYILRTIWLFSLVTKF